MSDTPILRTPAKTDEELATIFAAERKRIGQQCLAVIARDLGARYAPGVASFKTFLAETAGQKAALKALSELRINPKPEDDERWDAPPNIVLYGGVGTGKDHLLAALLYRAAGLGIACRWVNGQDLYAGIRDTMDKEGESELAFLSRWTEPSILALSDPVPPVGELTPWRKELLYRLVESRYRALKPTWVTVNARERQELDQKLGQQAFDRLQEGALVIPFRWKSYRKGKDL